MERKKNIFVRIEKKKKIEKFGRDSEEQTPVFWKLLQYGSLRLPYVSIFILILRAVSSPGVSSLSNLFPTTVLLLIHLPKAPTCQVVLLTTAGTD